MRGDGSLAAPQRDPVVSHDAMLTRGLERRDDAGHVVRPRTVMVIVEPVMAAAISRLPASMRSGMIV